MITQTMSRGWVEVFGTKLGSCVYCTQPVGPSYGFLIPRFNRKIRVSINTCMSHYNHVNARKLQKELLTNFQLDQNLHPFIDQLGAPLDEQEA